MKIVPLFAESLFAVQYDGEEENEYKRLMELWSGTPYLYPFAKRYGLPDVHKFIDQVQDDVDDVYNFMEMIHRGKERIDDFFQPLNDLEGGFIERSPQKGKPHRKSYLRLYAIRVDVGTYLITGGAIKLVQRMQDSEALMDERSKLYRVRHYLKQNGIFDLDSFREFKTEQDEDQ